MYHLVTCFLFIPFPFCSLFLPLQLIDFFQYIFYLLFGLLVMNFCLYHSNYFRVDSIYLCYRLPLPHVGILQLYTSISPSLCAIVVNTYIFVINLTMHCNWLFFCSKQSIIFCSHLKIEKNYLYLPVYLPFLVLFIPLFRSRFPSSIIFFLCEGLP